LNYWAGNGTYMIMYPTAPDLEIDIGLAGATDIVTSVHPINSPAEDEHTVTMPIWLGPQIRWGDGQTWASGDPATSNQGTGALLDPESWNFGITVRDINNINAYNVSYAEFGVDETVSVSVTGNPSGNAPPGAAGVGLTNPTQITYSTNTNYWVNISIPNLLMDGVGPSQIAATQLTVQNSNWDADLTNSEISVATAVAGASTDMVVWGLTAGPTPVNAPSNGTIMAGPWVTDFNAGTYGYNSYTQVDWWVTVPGGTLEGIYWATITVSIDS